MLTVSRQNSHRIRHPRRRSLPESRRSAARNRMPTLEQLEQRAMLSATISGTVFNDLDSDGTIDVGEGLPGWTVELQPVGQTSTSPAQTLTSQTPGDQFGYSVAATADRILVGAHPQLTAEWRIYLTPKAP